MFNINKAQTVKEWYFFDQYGVNNGAWNVRYNNPPVHHDSLLFGFISIGGSIHYVYKYTHRQGFIKKTKFVGTGGYIEAADMCIDTVNKFIFTFSRSGPRPPLFKFSHGVVFKLDYDLNILDSTIITYSTLYDPGPMVLNHNKLYVVGHNNNYFNTFEKINITVLDLNLQQLNFKVVSDSSNSYFCRKLIFDNANNLRLFINGAGNAIGPTKQLLILDTNLSVLTYTCLLKRCTPPFNYFFPSNIVKDKHGYTYSFDDYFYAQQTYPLYQIKQYHVRVNENEDTINTTFFPLSFNSVGGPGTGYTFNDIGYLQKTKNNGYIGLGSKYNYSNGIDPYNTGKFFIIDSNLKIINQFDVLKYTTAKLKMANGGTIKIGQTGSGMYYLVSEAKDSTQTNYKGVFYLMTIDSTAKITPTTPTLTPIPETIWDNITIYPNPTNDIVTIALPASSNYNIAVYNTLGQKLIDINDVTSNRQVNLANLPIGIYHFTFYETNLKKNITKKVIVQR
ncbi:MAG: T9SS type A sorting domain-containing protein [Bacteroidota bacterium]|nr:T9SS type A sorting domain-containing protein [Bacteroidota bacterium]MDP3144902.1 T9SS type A sorting domain-containing protein [Bacteroidota bacterium]MDP3557085.1 T9SS type A sorting domain-containing protein [Bacteroidota bacterium]